MRPRFLNAIGAQYATVGSNWSGWSFSARTPRAIEIINNKLVECAVDKPLCVLNGGTQEDLGYGITPGYGGVSLGVCSNIFKSEISPQSNDFVPTFDDVIEQLIFDPVDWQAWRTLYPSEQYSSVNDVPLHIVRAYDPIIFPAPNSYVFFQQAVSVDPSHEHVFSFFVAGDYRHKKCNFEIEVYAVDAGAPFIHLDPITGANDTRLKVSIPGGQLTRIDWSLWAPAASTLCEVRIYPTYPADPVSSSIQDIGKTMTLTGMHVGLYIGGWQLCTETAAPMNNGFGIGAFGIGAFGGVV